MTLKEIKAITKIKYKTIVKEKIRRTALEYLLNKQGKKGRENKYLFLEMEDYLLPFNDKQTIEQKCEMFAIKHSMIDIPANFSSKSEMKCECGFKEDMSHIYECGLYNMVNPEIPFDKIFTGNLKEQIAVYNKFAQNMKTRNLRKQTSTPGDQFDPLLYSNG